MLAGVLSAQEVRQDTIVPQWLVNGYFFEDVPERMPNFSLLPMRLQKWLVP